jgi:hypothetical protein
VRRLPCERVLTDRRRLTHPACACGIFLCELAQTPALLACCPSVLLTA